MKVYKWTFLNTLWEWSFHSYQCQCLGQLNLFIATHKRKRFLWPKLRAALTYKRKYSENNLICAFRKTTEVVSILGLKSSETWVLTMIAILCMNLLLWSRTHSQSKSGCLPSKPFCYHSTNGSIFSGRLLL